MEPSTPETPLAPPVRPDPAGVRRHQAWPGVFGILMIAFGVIGILLVLWSVAATVWYLVAPNTVPAMLLPGATLLPMWYHAVALGWSVLLFGVRVLEIVGGSGLLQRRAWGVRWARIWAWSHLAVTTLGTAWGLAMLPRTMQAAAQSTGGPMLPGTGAFAVLMSIVGWAITVSLPVVLLVWLRRAESRAEIAEWR